MSLAYLVCSIYGIRTRKIRRLLSSTLDCCRCRTLLLLPIIVPYSDQSRVPVLTKTGTEWIPAPAEAHQKLLYLAMGIYRPSQRTSIETHQYISISIRIRENCANISTFHCAHHPRKLQHTTVEVVAVVVVGFHCRCLCDCYYFFQIYQIQ